MEEALRLLDFLTTDSITQVFDMEGLNASTRDAQAKRAATEMTKMMTDYYPETLVRSSFRSYLHSLKRLNLFRITSAQEVLC